MLVGLVELRRDLNDVVSRAAFGGERVTIGRYDRPLAVLVPLADAQRLEALDPKGPEAA